MRTTYCPNCNDKVRYVGEPIAVILAENIYIGEDAAEQMSLGLVASSMITDDGVIDPRDTRTIIGFCLSVINNSEIKGASEFGVFRL